MSLKTNEKQTLDKGTTNEVPTLDKTNTNEPLTNIKGSTNDELTDFKTSTNDTVIDNKTTTNDELIDNKTTTKPVVIEAKVDEVANVWVKSAMSVSINNEYVGKVKSILSTFEDVPANCSGLLKSLVESHIQSNSKIANLKRQCSDLVKLNNENEDSFQALRKRFETLEVEHAAAENVIKSLTESNAELQTDNEKLKSQAPTITTSAIAQKPKKAPFTKFLYGN